MFARGAAEFLKRYGVPVLSYEDGDELTDGVVHLDGDYHVQIGVDYFILVREVNDGVMSFGKTRTKLQMVIEDYRNRDEAKVKVKEVPSGSANDPSSWKIV